MTSLDILEMGKRSLVSDKKPNEFHTFSVRGAAGFEFKVFEKRDESGVSFERRRFKSTCQERQQLLHGTSPL